MKHFLTQTLIGKILLLSNKPRYFHLERVEKVSDGIYSAIGYGVANVMMVEGTDGIIIVDTGNSVDQAQKILQAFRDITSKPIVTVIYTNSHPDHTGGVAYLLKMV